MTSEDKGEWKLVRVWECEKCKLLLKNGREVYGHECDPEKIKDELLSLGKIIEEQKEVEQQLKLYIENLKNITEDRDRYIATQRNRVIGLENFIKELNEVIDDHNKIVETRDETIKELNGIIDDQKKTIIDQSVYIDNNGSKAGGNINIENINVDIWNKDYNIKDSKDSGYREEIEVEIFERGKGKERIIIKNGKVVKKPDDIVIIGKNMPEGFIVKGIYRN